MIVLAFHGKQFPSRPGLGPAAGDHAFSETNQIRAALIGQGVQCFSQRPQHIFVIIHCVTSFLDFGTIIHDYGIFVKGFFKNFLTMVRLYGIVAPRMEVRA